MGIPIGEMFRVRIEGSETKCVSCESCGGEYRYPVSRTGSGSGFSWLFLDKDAEYRASAQAQFNLRETLRKAVELAPCPHCGWYQPEMIKLARSKYYTEVYYGSVSLITMGLLTLFFGFVTLDHARHESMDGIYWMTAIVLGTLGGFGLVLRNMAIRFIDPNQEPQEERLEVAYKKAIGFKEDMGGYETERSGFADTAVIASDEELSSQRKEWGFWTLFDERACSASLRGGGLVLLAMSIPLFSHFVAKDPPGKNQGPVLIVLATIFMIGFGIIWKAYLDYGKLKEIVHEGELVQGKVLRVTPLTMNEVTVEYSIGDLKYQSVFRTPRKFVFDQTVTVAYNPDDPREGVVLECYVPVGKPSADKLV